MPKPWAPAVTTSHGALLTAVHAQCEGELTVRLPVPPFGPYVAPAGASVTEHGARPSSRTVTTCPPIVSEPVRTTVVGLADAATTTWPLPVPLAPLVTVSQSRSEAAVQVQ